MRQHVDSHPSSRSARLAVLGGCAVLLATLAACGGERDARVEQRSDAQREIATREQEPLEPIVAEGDGPALSLAQSPFDFAWDLKLPAPVHTSWLSENVPDLLFVQTANGEVHGIDVYSGVTRWVSQPLPKLIEHRPYVQRNKNPDPRISRTDDRLYVVSGDHLFVIDCHYGQLIWRHHLGQSGPHGFQPSSGPYAVGQGDNLRVYIGDWEGRIRVLTVHEEDNRPYVRWQWNLRAVPSAQPAGEGELVYVGAQDGRLHCFGLDREKLWTYGARGTILGSGVVRGRAFYFGAEDNILHALNRLSGEELGNLYLGAPIRRRPFVFAAEPLRLYVWTDADATTPRGLRALHTMDDSIVLEDVEVEYEDGKRLEVNRLGQDWFLEGVTRLVASSPAHLYLMRPGSSIVLAIDRETGEAAYHWDLNDGLERAERITHVTEYQDPSDEIRTVITADRHGLMTAYRYFGATSEAERAIAQQER